MTKTPKRASINVVERAAAKAGSGAKVARASQTAFRDAHTTRRKQRGTLKNMTMVRPGFTRAK